MGIQQFQFKRGHFQAGKSGPQTKTPVAGRPAFGSFAENILLQRRDATTVAGPRAFVGADDLRALLAVADRLQARRGHALGDQVLTDRRGTTLAEGDVVLARAALVAMAFDGELIAFAYCFSQAACLVSVARPSSRTVDASVSKYTRSPTFCRKSATEPGETVVPAGAAACSLLLQAATNIRTAMAAKALIMRISISHASLSRPRSSQLLPPAWG